MRHPNAFPRFSNPGEVRSYLHSVYQRYADGTDLLPKAKVTDPYLLPRKTFAIANALHRAWYVIDEDKDYFDAALTAAIRVQERTKTPTNSLIIAKIGRNATNFGLVSMPGNNQKGKVVYGRFDNESVIAMLEETPMYLTDGRCITYVNGSLNPDLVPDLQVIRASGPAAVFVGQPEPSEFYEAAD